MADEMRAFDAELSAQGFEVGDKLLEPEGLVGAFGTAMAAQIVGDAAEMRSQLLDNPVPSVPLATDYQVIVDDDAQRLGGRTIADAHTHVMISGPGAPSCGNDVRAELCPGELSHVRDE